MRRVNEAGERLNDITAYSSSADRLSDAKQAILMAQELLMLISESYSVKYAEPTAYLFERHLSTDYPPPPVMASGDPIIPVPDSPISTEF